jgi:tetratricopeptide (TPR) repeat protein
LNKVVAEEHESMIPLYEQILLYVPDSAKSGDYYYALARAYNKKGEREKALMYGKKAQERLGAYKVKEFLEKIDKIEKTPSKEE